MEFGFLVFTTPPLAAAHSLDAKFTTSKFTRELKTWAKFGPPLGQTWEPTEAERRKFPDMMPLVANDWTVLSPLSPAGGLESPGHAVDLAEAKSIITDPIEHVHTPLWHGTILPESDADIWLAAAFADYEHVASRERLIKSGFKNKDKPTTREREQLALASFGPTSLYLTAVARRDGKDQALADTHVDLRADEWYQIAAGKGVLLMAELRGLLGEARFDTFMDEFGRHHPGQPVSTTTFFDAAEKAYGKTITDLKEIWRSSDAVDKMSVDVRARRSSGRFWSIDSFERQLEHAIIVFGTIADAEAQRHAAQVLQRKLASRFANMTVPVVADTDAGDSQLTANHVLLVGRPATNRVSAICQGSACRFLHRVVHHGGRVVRPPPDGDRRRRAESAGREPVGRHLRRPERGGNVDVHSPIPRPRCRPGRGHADAGGHVKRTTGDSCSVRSPRGSRRAGRVSLIAKGIRAD